jgi:signal transduction histidine kinase
VLARSFNHMTGQLASQRERLVQSERVAAWRELARRLAHELKNPLFPLQLTVENLVRRANCLKPSSTKSSARAPQTLGMEIANLKTIIGRFSDFSKMPKPELERIDAKDAIERVLSLYEKRRQERGQREAKIHFESDLSEPDAARCRPRTAASRAEQSGSERDGRDAGGRHADALRKAARRQGGDSRSRYRRRA